MNKKGIKKYYSGVPELMAPKIASVKTADVPLVSGTPKQVSISEQPGFSFKDKAGAFMDKNGSMITQAAGSLMPLLMKKPDPNAKPYKKGSKLIKYQAGTNNAATDDPEDLHAYFGRILGKNKTVQPSNEPQGEVGPTRKEAADLMRTYNKANKNNPKVIGKVDEEEIAKREKELKNLTSSNKTKLPITYNNPSAGPSKEELETGRNKEISENAEKARKTYETRLDAEAARTQYEKKQAIEGEKNMVGPSREDLIKYKKEAEEAKKTTAVTTAKLEEPKKKNLVTYNRGDFNTFSAADKKKYRENIAKGVAFSIGDRKYAAAKPEEMAFSARMASKKNKSNLSKRSSIDDILDKYDRTKPGSIAYEKIKNTKPDNFWKSIYDTRKPTVGKNFGTTKTPFAGAREDASNLIQGQELVRMNRMGKQNNFYNPFGLPVPKSREKSTNVPTDVMNYPLVQKIIQNRKEVAPGGEYYVISKESPSFPFTKDGLDSFDQPIHDIYLKSKGKKSIKDRNDRFNIQYKKSNK